MKNWMRSITNNWINMDYLTQIYVHQDGEKYKVIGTIAGSETAFLLSEDFDLQADAMAYLDSLMSALT